MAYYDTLVAQWGTLTGTTAQKLVALNAQTVAGPKKDVPVSSVVGYLALNAKLSGVQKYASAPPATEAGIAGAELVAILNCPNAPPFGMADPTTYAAVNGLLSALASDSTSGITSADVTALLALAATSVPWWQANGYSSPISASDLAAAGGLT